MMESETGKETTNSRFFLNGAEGKKHLRIKPLPR